MKYVFDLRITSLPTDDTIGGILTEMLGCVPFVDPIEITGFPSAFNGETKPLTSCSNK